MNMLCVCCCVEEDPVIFRAYSKTVLSILMEIQWFWGSLRASNVWKLLRIESEIILELLENHLEHFEYKLQKREHLKSQFQISSSSNESRPGTHFQMCSRSRQYQRLEYHQDLLTWKSSH